MNNIQLIICWMISFRIVACHVIIFKLNIYIAVGKRSAFWLAASIIREANLPANRHSQAAKCRASHCSSRVLPV